MKKCIAKSKRETRKSPYWCSETKWRYQVSRMSKQMKNKPDFTLDQCVGFWLPCSMARSNYQVEGRCRNIFYPLRRKLKKAFGFYLIESINSCKLTKLRRTFDLTQPTAEKALKTRQRSMSYH